MKALRCGIGTMVLAACVVAHAAEDAAALASRGRHARNQSPSLRSWPDFCAMWLRPFRQAETHLLQRRLIAAITAYELASDAQANSHPCTRELASDALTNLHPLHSTTSIGSASAPQWIET